MNDGRSSLGVGRGAGLTNETPFTQTVGETWTRYWFTPADPRPLAIVRILAGGLALMLWLSYAADLQAWFGPAGIVSPDLLDQWRSGWAASLFDFAVAPAVLTALYAAGAVVLALLTVGLATPVVSILAAIFFSSLLHRGPMLAGPADDANQALSGQGRVLVRASGTEELVRVMVEAPNQDQCDEICASLVAAVEAAG